MSFKNLFFPTPQKITPESSPAAMSVHDSMDKKPTAVEKTVAPPRQKSVHTPIYGSMKKTAVEEVAASARPQKNPVHPHRKSIGTKGCENEEGISARTLRKIKRRLFLEAVNSEQRSISTKGSAAATCTVDSRRVALLRNEQERIFARTLRQIKRRLFLEAVNSEQPIRIKSPRNIVRQ